MIGRVVSFNGTFVPESEARVSIFDSALIFGDMAFEMTRTFNGTPFRLRQHLERLYASLRLIEVDSGLPIDEMEELTLETLARNQSTEAENVDWQIMHNVSCGPLPIYKSVFADGLRPTVSINCWPLITLMGSFAPNYRTGVQLVVPSQRAIPADLLDPRAKTRSRLHYRTALLQGARMGADVWPLMLDPDGYIAEGPGWNVMLVKNGELLSPEPRNILQGVSRDVSRDLAGQLGIPMRETNLAVYDALQADEIFCTATTYCLVHAVSFEGRTIGDGRPGPVFSRLMDAWKKLAGVDFVAQAHSYSDILADWEARQRP